MSDSDTRKYALLGWFVWSLAKRRLRRSVRADDTAPKRRTFLRFVVAVAVLGALAAAWAKRNGGGGSEWNDTPA